LGNIDGSTGSAAPAGVADLYPSLQSGDLLVQDRMGNWTYQFAVTVGDMEQEVDLVIRGQDL